DTVLSRKLLTAAMPNPLRHVSLSGSVTFSQRPPWQTSSPLHTSPSLQLVPSGSIWQVGEQQSPAAVLPSSQVSPPAGSTMASPETAAGMVVGVVVVTAVVVVVLTRVVVVDDGTVVDVVVVVLEVVEVVGGTVTVVVGTLVVVVVGTDSNAGTQSSRRWISVPSSVPNRLRVKKSTSPKAAVDCVREHRRGEGRPGAPGVSPARSAGPPRPAGVGRGAVTGSGPAGPPTPPARAAAPA